MRYSSLSPWVGELWFYHQGFWYCIFKPCVFLGHIICTIYTVSHFAQPETFLHLHIAYIHPQQAPFWGFLQSLRCSFLPEKETHHWTIHCCIVIEWLKLFQTTLKSERWRYGEKFSGDFCTWLPMIYHGVMWSSPSSLYRCQFTHLVYWQQSYVILSHSFCSWYISF